MAGRDIGPTVPGVKRTLLSKEAHSCWKGCEPGAAIPGWIGERNVGYGNDQSRARPNSATQRAMLETAAATRLLESEGILDYSGHVSTRIPGRDAFVIQIGSASRAEVITESMLVVDYDGKVLEGDGQPPSELPIHLEILRARPDVQSVLHSHMELAIAFTMMEGVKLLPMRARASRWKSGIPIDPDQSHIKLPD